MLEAKDVTLTLAKNGRNLTDHFDFFLRPGDKAAIIGEEGNGKSTLLKYLYDPALVSGYCEATGWVNQKGRLAYLPQQLPCALENCTLEEFFSGAELWRLADTLAINAAWVCSRQTLGTLSGGEKVKEFLDASYDKAIMERARTFLGSMRFTHEEMTGKIGALSGGQQAKLLFLDMVLREANVLVLDEPTRNFSPLSAPIIREALRVFGGTIISVSHDRRYLSEVCDEVYSLTEEGLSRIR